MQSPVRARRACVPYHPTSQGARSIDDETGLERRLGSQCTQSSPKHSRTHLDQNRAVETGREGGSQLHHEEEGRRPSFKRGGAMIPYYDGYAGQPPEGEANGTNGRQQQQQQEAAPGSMAPPPSPPILTPTRDVEAFNRCVRVQTWCSMRPHHPPPDGSHTPALTPSVHATSPHARLIFAL